AAAGVATKIKLPRQEFCEACNGTGAKKGTGVVTCTSCGGRGQVAYQQGFFTITRTCPSCQGAGQIVKERCLDCRGQGRVEREKKLKIPEGTQSGAVFRVKGKGLPDPHGGGRGDLYYHVRVLTPTKLTREQRKLMEQLGATLKVENKPAERGSSIFDKVKDIF